MSATTNSANTTQPTPLQRLIAQMHPNAFSALLCLVIGLLTGSFAALLKLMIGAVSRWLTNGLATNHGNWILLILPVAGILLTGIFTRYIIKDNIAHATEKIKHQLAEHVEYLSPKLIFGPMIASTLTLGFGGSAGSEGPIATVGSAIGGNLSRWCGLPPRVITMMIGCGAGAGIAGIFKAPVGGMLFTLECLGLPLSTAAVVALLATCVVSALTAVWLSGGLLDLPFIKHAPFPYEYLPAIILLGACCGMYALYYRSTGSTTERILESIKNPWIANTVSGITIAIMLFVFPALYGEGYGVMGTLLNNPVPTLGDCGPLYFLRRDHYTLMLIAAGILLCKGVAAYSTNSGGGVAGEFAPALFAGAMAGWLFATLANTVFGLALPVGVFVLSGMAAVMGQAVNAPLMAIFLAVEMTASYDYFLPVGIAGAASWITVNLIRRLN